MFNGNQSSKKGDAWKGILVMYAMTADYFDCSDLSP
jgi:hypothetical protein